MKYFTLLLTFTLFACMNLSMSKNTLADLSKDLRSGKAVYIKDGNFTEELDFTQLLLQTQKSDRNWEGSTTSPICFINCTFKNKVTAHKEDGKTYTCLFINNVSFLNCVFEEDANFNGMTVLGDFNTSGSTFRKGANFKNIDLRGSAEFEKTSFFENTFFQMAHFKDKANFFESTFSKQASFQNAIFHDVAQFANARFLDYADFSLVDFNKNVDFSYIESSTKFNLSNAQCLRSFKLQKANINKFNIRKTRFFDRVMINEPDGNGEITFEKCNFLFSDTDQLKDIKGVQFID